MKKVISRFSLKIQIGLIGAIGALALLLLGSFQQYERNRESAFWTKAQAVSALHEQITSLKLTLLEARRAEKDFLLRNDEKYVVRNKEMVARADGLLAEAVAHPEASAIGDLLSRTKKELAAYRDAFSTVAATRSPYRT